MSLALLFSIYSCNKNKEDNVNIVSHAKDKDVLIWKHDSIGCDKIRTIELGKRLFDKYLVNIENEDALFNILGKPNKILYENDVKHYIFYINSCCKNNVLLEECDYSFIVITIEKNRIKFSSGIN